MIPSFCDHTVFRGSSQGNPLRECYERVKMDEIINEIISNADAIIREQGQSSKDPLGRMKTLSRVILNKSESLDRQFACLETTVRYAKDLSLDELDAYEDTLTAILVNILDAKRNINGLRGSIGGCIS